MDEKLKLKKQKNGSYGGAVIQIIENIHILDVVVGFNESIIRSCFFVRSKQPLKTKEQWIEEFEKAIQVLKACDDEN